MPQTIALVTALLCATACSKDSSDKDKTPNDGPETGKTSEPPKDEPPEATGEVTRLFGCDFVAWSGEGPERQAKFALTNKGKKPVKRIQTWIYYYQKGEQIDRYPHALAQTFEPGAKAELALGSKGTKIKEGVDATACEITEATYADGETWANHNLNYNGLMIPRALEGETHEQLLARTGVAVRATWLGETGDGGAKFALENTRDRPLRARTAWVYYYDVDGKQLGRAVSNLMFAMEPKAKADQELGYKGDKIPEGTRVIEATVSVVEFADGAKEKWINRNLAPFERPMESKPPADPAEPADPADHAEPPAAAAPTPK
jgi:hypothetical protein